MRIMIISGRAEHLALINLALFDPDYHIMKLNDEVYNNDKQIYERLLNIAPEGGPTSKSVYEWSITSRLIWPYKCWYNKGSNMEYNGLDYMLLHNLYYIAFRKEDFMTVKIGNSIGVDDGIKRYYSQRSGFIESDGLVLGNDVQYTATRGITLKNGFAATSTGGKTFRATIVLEDNYKAFDYKIIGEQSGNVRSLVKAVKQNKTDCKNKEYSENSRLSNIDFYPNPAIGIITINANEVQLPVTLNITDTKGIVVFTEKLLTSPQQVDLSALPKGVYFIQFYSNNSTVTKKIILN